MPAPPRIVVLGAGVSGLTTALQLARSGSYNITIVSKHMPGDYDIEYASPWAGANYLPDDIDPLDPTSSGFSKPSTPARVYERDTWPELERLARDVPEAGVHFQRAVTYRRAKDTGTPTGEWMKELMRDDAWFKDLLPEFRLLDKSELPPGTDGGTSFMSVCINTSFYLPWLASQCLGAGVVIKRGIAHHISDVASMHHTGEPADLVVNCTGLSSLRLGGVEDASLYPARGQIVVVRSEPQVMVSISGTDDGPEEATYIMQRAAGGGTILGGCLQANNWESQPDLNLANRIMKRCVDLCPALVPPGKGPEALSVVRHGVGLRPMRKDGIRVEKDQIGGRGGTRLKVVHNYGHGGYGYQTSYGCAQAAERLVIEMLSPSARL